MDISTKAILFSVKNSTQLEFSADSTHIFYMKDDENNRPFCLK